MKLNKTYIIITLILFLTEVLIAFYLKSGFIRHTFGDFLVVILIFYFFKSFLSINSLKLAFLVLLFAFIVEFLQPTNYLELFNLQNNQLAKLVLGSTFHISDLVAYNLSILSVLFFDYKLQNHE